VKDWFARWNAPQGLIFPRWVDQVVKVVGLLAAVGGGYATVLVAYGFSPKTTDVGYAPEQPIPYSHAVHAGQLGIDCRYCHSSVEDTHKANIPPTQTCLNCHSTILTESPKLQALRDARDTGLPVRWVRVHSLADHAYFNHAAHVQRGVGCVSCHGRVDTMEVVRTVETLSMSWCLDCHRNPERHLRPPEKVTDMTWKPTDADGRPVDPVEYGRQRMEKFNINPPTDCSTCHR
jgi:hypothetical protein